MNASHPRRARLGRSSGFSLIEVLVALLILLIGLLGVVRMQLLSVQNNQGAYLRTQATYIASDMLDRLRANRAGRNSLQASNATDEYDGFTFKSGDSFPPDPNCADTPTGCNQTELAALDKREIAAYFDNVYGLGSSCDLMNYYVRPVLGLQLACLDPDP